MAHVDKVIATINAPGDSRCVDIFVGPHGGFGFQEYRRNLEDGRDWYPVRPRNSAAFDTLQSAKDSARFAVAWLEQVEGVG